MSRCTNCGRPFEPSLLDTLAGAQDFCSDGCRKDYEIKRRTLERTEGDADDVEQWKKSALMIARANLQMLPWLRNLLISWAKALRGTEEQYVEAFRDNFTAWKLLERVVSAESNLDPGLLNEIRKELGGWDSERAQRRVEELKVFASKYYDSINEQESRVIETFAAVEKSSQRVVDAVAQSL